MQKGCVRTAQHIAPEYDEYVQLIENYFICSFIVVGCINYDDEDDDIKRK